MKQFVFPLLLTLLPLIPAFSSAEQDPVTVGVILPMTGGASAFGDLVRKGIEAADTKGIKLVFEDDGCNPAKAVQAFNRLSAVDGAKYFLGPVCPGGTLAIAPKLPALDAVMMGLCTGIESGYDLSNGRVFLPQNSASREAAFNASKMYELGRRKVAILYWEQEFTLAHESAFRESFKGSIVASIPMKTVEKSEMRAAILKLKALDFDSIYLPIVEPFLAGFLKELHSYGLRDKKVYSIFSVEMPEVLTVNGSDAEGLVFSSPEVSTPLALGTYFSKIGTELLAGAIRKCGKDSDCVLKKLTSENSFDHGTLVSGLKLRTVKSGKFEDYSG